MIAGITKVSDLRNKVIVLSNELDKREFVKEKVKKDKRIAILTSATQLVNEKDYRLIIVEEIWQQALDRGRCVG